MKSPAFFLSLSLACALVILVGNVSADDFESRQDTATAFGAQGVTGTVAMSPEMWLYLHQEQRAEDPQTIVRRKAQAKSAARQNRIAAQRWFGYSAARPRANPTPWTSQYSAIWVGNGSNPFHWRGNGGFTVALPSTSTVRR